MDEYFAILALGGSYAANFNSFTQNASAPIYPGTCTIIARALVVSGPANDINLANNIIIQGTPVTASILIGDVNCDATVDMADISTIIDAFMTSFDP